MSRFYGTLQGNRGEATRCGTKSSGIETYTASWSGAVRAYAYDVDGEDNVRVELVPWKGHGSRFHLYSGPVDPDPELLADRLEEAAERIREL